MKEKPDDTFDRKILETDVPYPGLITREEEETAWKEILIEIEDKNPNYLPVIGWLTAACLMVAFGLYFWIDTEKPNVYITQAWEKLEVVLKDKTEVTLNSDSRLEIGEKFNENDRQVSLSGEAFFNVSHDLERAFIIHIGKNKIRVLGTSFNVNQSDDGVLVSVRSGEVELTSEIGSMKLSAGEGGIISGSGRITKSEWDQNDLSWYSGTLEFKNKPMRQVAETLTKLTQKPVEVTEAIANCRLTIRIEYEKVEEVLDVIAQTLEIKWEEDSGRIIFSGNGC